MSLFKDRIDIYSNEGELLDESIACSVQGTRIIIKTTDPVVEVGMFFTRKLNNGMEEWFEVTQADYYEDPSMGNISCHVTKSGKPEKEQESKVGNVDTSKVFVVHGHDEKNLAAMKDLLRASGLIVIEWEAARKLTSHPSPQIKDIVGAAFRNAQAVVLLFTGDDEARIHAEHGTEELGRQPRANVIFEAGMAMATHPERTIIVEFGNLRRFSDLDGTHTVRFKDDSKSRREILSRLKDCGCVVDDSGSDWMDAGKFDIAKET